MADNPFPLDRDRLLSAYRTMRTIREFEDRLHVDFSRGDIPGFVHLYAGEEACGTGIMLHLRPTDRIASTHRGHGHCIAKGVDPRRMMKEIYGRKGGSCEGKGGSMHIAELDVGMMGANGILGAGAPLACGAALGVAARHEPGPDEPQPHQNGKDPDHRQNPEDVGTRQMLKEVEGDRAVNAGRTRDLVHAARFSFGVEAKEDVAPGEVAERSKSAVHVRHQVLPGMGPLTGGGAPVGA